MRINSNIPSLNAQRYLRQTSQAISRALERLSSGKRVNSAKDDAAGLGIASRLESDIRGNTRALLNVNEGMGMLHAAEGAMSIQADILQQLRDLALQSTSELLSASNRQILTNEFNSLLEEFDRIASTTQFGSTQLLDGSISEIRLQAGSSKDSAMSLTLAQTTANEIFMDTTGTGNFVASTAVSMGNWAISGGLKIADMNNDGIQDLVTGDWGDQSVSIAYGLGENQYSTKVSRSNGTSSWASGLSLGDLNGDGYKDMVSTNYGEQTFSVWLSDGQGGFNAATTYATNGLNNYASAIADVDGDGDLDVAIANYLGNQVTIHSNNGSGTFTISQTLAVVGGANPTGLNFADLNNDGKLDLLISNVTDWEATIYLGRGHGLFQSAKTANFGASHSESAIGDMNGDGILDVVSKSIVGEKVTVSFGRGDGSFQTRVEYDSPGTNRVDIADVDNDGDLDVVALQINSTTFRIFKNSGSGVLSQYSQVSTPGTTMRAAFGDLNNDGIADLAIQEVTTPRVRTYLNLTERRSQFARVNIETVNAARDTLEFLDIALNNMSASRASLGSQMNRLESTRATLQISHESLSGALSNIQDADLAEEAAHLIRHQVMQQANVSVLAQSNLQMQVVLNLLK